VATYSATCYAVQRGRATGELISMLKRVIPVGTRVTGVLVDRSAVFLGTTADPAASVNMAMLRSGWAGMDDHAQDWQTFDWFPEARAAHIAAVAALHAGQTTQAEIEEQERLQREHREQAEQQKREQAATRELDKAKGRCFERLQAYHVRVLGGDVAKELAHTDREVCEDSDDPDETLKALTP
jgi:hypothetical protein